MLPGGSQGIVHSNCRAFICLRIASACRCTRCQFQKSMRLYRSVPPKRSEIRTRSQRSCGRRCTSHKTLLITPSSEESLSAYRPSWSVGGHAEHFFVYVHPGVLPAISQNGDICPTPQKGIVRQYAPAQLLDVSIFIGRFENSIKRHEKRRSNPWDSKGTPFESKYWRE